MLRSDQFKNRDLEDIYFNGAPRRGLSIPRSQHLACHRRLELLEVASRPEDLDLPGLSYRISGATHSVSISGCDNRISCTWPATEPLKIDYV